MSKNMSMMGDGCSEVLLPDTNNFSSGISFYYVDHDFFLFGAAVYFDFDFFDEDNEFKRKLV
ncbi:hypothetical protein ACO0K7_07145 [Undibacterium sp. Ji67W]|uniref:hypothetical protein n=1 Tax=Undibacterium sp. Ji67W TaxID=3413042 RepID=UPI003BEFBAD4